MKKNVMKIQNWIIVAAGIVVTYLGMLMMIPITRNYDGGYAFITIALTIGGLATVITGLSLSFETKEDSAE